MQNVDRATDGARRSGERARPAARRFHARAILACVHATSTDTAAELATTLARFIGLATNPQGRLIGEFERLELTFTQYKALHVTADGEPTVKELAERLGLSLPGCSRAVDHLVRRGLMDRREDAADRRMKRVSVTPAGEEAVRTVSDARRRALEAFARDIPPAQRERLLAALTPILEDLEKDR